MCEAAWSFGGFEQVAIIGVLADGEKGLEWARGIMKPLKLQSMIFAGCELLDARPKDYTPLISSPDDGGGSSLTSLRYLKLQRTEMYITAFFSSLPRS